MNGLGKLFVLSTTIAFAAYLLVHCCRCLGVPPTPSLSEDAWWGPDEAKDLGEAVAPFKINISEKILQDLNDRLDRYLRDNPTPPLEGRGFEYGFNTNYLKEVVAHWRRKYQWRKREAYLNKLPQFKTFVNGLDVHFVAVKPDAAGKKVLPLLLLHGWPGSVREFYDLIPMLTTPSKDRDFVFHVVAPSLPGYGFSSGSAKPGLGPAEMAVVVKNLMKRLGFDKFYVQGGDWGAKIADDLGILFPESVLGIHSNFCGSMTFASNLIWFLGSFFPRLAVEDKHERRLYPMKEVLLNILRESGYFHLQATKPDTIGTALNDSPVGLAAYILEKFSTWTDPSWRSLPDGGLTRKFALDDLLDNVMIYWISGSITTSQRLYAEAFTETNRDMQRIPVEVPTACARFRNELLWQTKSQLSSKYPNLLHVSDFDDGGHFAAFEVPQLLARDVWTAVAKFEDFRSRSSTN